MEDKYIVLEESNVSNIGSIEVHEERIKEDAIDILNQDQILNMIANLVHDKHNDKLSHRVNIYMKLIENNGGTIHSISEESQLNLISSLYYVINCKVHLIDNNDEKEKKPIRSPYFTQTLDAYLKTFKEHNRNTTESYVLSSKALYNLNRPFSLIADNTEGERMIIKETQSAFRLTENGTFEKVGLIGQIIIDIGKKPLSSEEDYKFNKCISGLDYNGNTKKITIYNGDIVDVIGFFNEPIKTDQTDPIQNFLIDEYLESLSKLNIGDKVNIFFNTFAFDRYNTLITEIASEVIDTEKNCVTIKFPKALIINSILHDTYTYNFRDIPVFYIYSLSYEGFRFHKSLLVSSRIFFPLSTKTVIETIQEWVSPQCLLELIYIHKNQIGNIYELKTFLKSNNLTIDNLNKDSRNTLEYYFNLPKVNLPLYLNKLEEPKFEIEKTKYNYLNFEKFLNFFKDQYNVYNTYIDAFSLNRQKFIENKDDHGHMYILDVLKYILNVKSEKIESNRSSLKNLESSTNRRIKSLQEKLNNNMTTPSKINIVREYNNLEDLENDNDTSIKEGENAVLRVRNQNIVYVRKTIRNKSMWVKLLITPFSICNTLPTFNDTLDDTFITFDPFDNLCKNIKHIRQNALFKNLKTLQDSIKNAESIVNNKEDVIKYIDELYEHYYKEVNLGNFSNLGRYAKPSRTLVGYSVISTLEGYLKSEDDDINFSNIYDNFIYGEDFHDAMPNNIINDNDEEIQDQKDNRNEYILKQILKQIQLRFPSGIMQELLNILNTRFGKEEDVVKKLKVQKEKVKLFIEKYHINIICYTAAWIALIIASEYPTYLIKNIHPQCRIYMSHFISTTSGKDKNIINYITCIVQTLSQDNKDSYFNKLSKLSFNSIQSEIIDSMKKIRSKYTEIDNKINDFNKQQEVKEGEMNQYTVLNVFFKPQFNFENSVSKIAVISFLKNLHEAVKKESRLNKDNSINSCCIQTISDRKLNFYDVFDSIQTLKGDVYTQKRTSYIPKSEVNIVELLFEGKAIKTRFETISNKEFDIELKTFSQQLKSSIDNTYLNDDYIMLDAIKVLDTDEKRKWIFKDLLTATETSFNDIITFLSKYTQDDPDLSISKDFILKNILNAQNVKNPYNLRSSILSFLRNQFPSYFSKVIHKMQTNEPIGKHIESFKYDDFFDNALDCISSVFKSAFVKNKLNTLFIETGNSKHDDINLYGNLYILTYIFFKFLHIVLYIAVKEVLPLSINNVNLNLLNVYTQDNKRCLICCKIVSFVLKNFEEFLKINDVTEDTAKVIEVFREKKNRDEMSKLSSDEKMRALQRTMKKLIDTKIDVADLNISNKVRDNKYSDEENYRMDYEGENED